MPAVGGDRRLPTCVIQENKDRNSMGAGERTCRPSIGPTCVIQENKDRNTVGGRNRRRRFAPWPKSVIQENKDRNLAKTAAIRHWRRRLPTSVIQENKDRNVAVLRFAAVAAQLADVRDPGEQGSKLRSRSGTRRLFPLEADEAVIQENKDRNMPNVPSTGPTNILVDADVRDPGEQGSKRVAISRRRIHPSGRPNRGRAIQPGENKDRNARFHATEQERRGLSHAGRSVIQENKGSKPCAPKIRINGRRMADVHDPGEQGSKPESYNAAC